MGCRGLRCLLNLWASRELSWAWGVWSYLKLVFHSSSKHDVEWRAVFKNHLITAFKQNPYIIWLASTVIFLITSHNIHTYFESTSLEVFNLVTLFPCFSVFFFPTMTVNNPDASVLLLVLPHLHSSPLPSPPLRLPHKDTPCCVASQELVRENSFVIWIMCSQCRDGFVPILPVQRPGCDIFRTALPFPASLHPVGLF